MLSPKLPIHLTGFAVVLLAGLLFAAPLPALAQSSDDDAVTSANPDAAAGDQVAPDDDDDGIDEDGPPPSGQDDRGGYDSADGDNPRDADTQDFARSSEENRCAAEFRSFDPTSGTYVTDDGDRETCPYL